MQKGSKGLPSLHGDAKGDAESYTYNGLNTCSGPIRMVGRVISTKPKGQGTTEVPFFTPPRLDGSGAGR